MQILFQIAVTLFVGFLCGSTSVGGVLLIPALDAVLPLGLRTVMGTVLLSFFFAGIVGTVMHCRAGRMDWRVAVPLSLGCLMTGYPGAVTKEYVSIPALSAVLGAAIVIAGATSFRPTGSAWSGGALRDVPPRPRDAQLFFLGAGVSFLSAMTGAGGPVLSVPAMLLLGYGPLTAIAVAQPLQVAVTFSGSIGNIVVGSVDYPAAMLTAILMIAGVALGVFSVRYFRPRVLRLAVAVLCVATGGYMLFQAARVYLF